MKNKKLLLSVLSTAVVASMASSAFAAEAGIYIGGDVKHYYNISSFFEPTNSAKIVSEANSAKLKNVVFVDTTGKAATLDNILASGSAALTDDLEAVFGDSLHDAYVPVDKNGQEGTDPVVPEPSDSPSVDGLTQVVDGGKVTISGNAVNADSVEVTVFKASEKVATKSVDVADNKFSVDFSDLVAGDYTYEVVASNADEDSEVKSGSFKVEAPAELKVDSVSAINASGEKVDVTSGTKVDADSSLVVKFNDQVDDTTVTPNAFGLYTDAGVKQTVLVSYDKSKKEATIAPVTGTALPRSASLKLKAEGIKDKAGTALNYELSFGTNTNVVILTKTVPTNGTLTANVVATVNADLAANTVNAQTVRLFNQTDNKYVAGAVSYNAKQITFDPDATLEVDKIYALTISKDAEALDGNKVGKDITIKFNTENVWGLSTEWFAGLSGIGSNANVYGKLTGKPGQQAFTYKAMFSTAMDASTINGDNVFIREIATGEKVSATVSYDPASYLVTIAPSADLKDSTNYEVVVSKNVKSTLGTKQSDDLKSPFSTGDFTAPTVVSSVPANGQAFAIDGKIVVQFSEAMKATDLITANKVNTTNVELKNNTKDSVVATTTWGAALSSDGKTLTITPVAGTTDWAFGQSYTLKLKGGLTAGIQDNSLNGNRLAQDQVITFLTQSADANPPVVESTKLISTTGSATDAGTALVNGVANVGDKDIYLYFSKTIDHETVIDARTITANTATGLAAATGNVVVEKYDVATGQWNKIDASGSTSYGEVFGSKTYVKIANAAFTTGYKYRVSILPAVSSTAVVEDTNNLDNAGKGVQLANQYSIEFTKGTGPSLVDSVTVTSVALPAMAKGDNQFTIATGVSTGNVLAIELEDGSTFVTTAADVAGTTVTLKDAVPSTVAANAKAWVGGANVAKYETGVERARDIVVKIAAQNSTTKVNADTVTKDSVFLKDSAGAAVAASVTNYVVGDDVYAVIHPNAALGVKGTYTVNVTDAITDVLGNKLSPSNFSFSTNASSAAATVSDYNIQNGALGVPVNTSISFKVAGYTSAPSAFSQAAGVGNISLVGGGGKLVDASLSFDKSTGVVTIKPNVRLLADTTYTLSIGVDALGTGTLGTAKTLEFKTGADIPGHLTSAKWFEVGKTGLADDVVVLTFDENVDNSTATLANFNYINGLIDGTEADISTAGKQVTIKFKNTDPVNSFLLPGVTTIAPTAAVKNADPNPPSGQSFSSDSATVSK